MSGVGVMLPIHGEQTGYGRLGAQFLFVAVIFLDPRGWRVVFPAGVQQCSFTLRLYPDVVVL